MVDKYFKKPFAITGDKEAVPDDSVNTLVSYETGYTPEYELDPDTDPSGNYIGRQRMNQLFFDITGNLKTWQEHGFPTFIELSVNGGVPFPYKQNSIVTRSGVDYVSLFDNNEDAPPSAKWGVFSGASETRQLFNNTDHTIAPVNQRVFDGDWLSASIDDYGFDDWLKYDATRMGQIKESGDYTPNTVYSVYANNVLIGDVTSPASGNFGIAVPFTLDKLAIRQKGANVPYEFEDADIKISKCLHSFQFIPEYIYTTVADLTLASNISVRVHDMRDVPIPTFSGTEFEVNLSSLTLISESSSSFVMRPIPTINGAMRYRILDITLDTTLHIADATWSTL